MNQSAAVNTSITLSWKGSYSAEQSSQNRAIRFKRYPQNNSSAVVQIGIASILPLITGLDTNYQSPFKPRIAVIESASALSEPAITIQDVTKQDEAFYRIEVFIGTATVASHTIFLMVFGNYVHSTCYVCVMIFILLPRTKSLTNFQFKCLHSN